MNTQTELRGLRDVLYDTVLSGTYLPPKGFLRDACNAWVKVSGASFGQVWLHNEHTEAWELLHSSYVGPVTFPDSFPDTLPDNTRPMLEYACEQNRIHFVASRNDTRQIGSQLYSVAHKDTFCEAGFSSFLCVPLLTPPQQTSLSEASGLGLYHPPDIDIRGCLCLHFTLDSAPHAHDDTSHSIMQRMTSLALLRSYESQQRDILLTLNGLSEKYSFDDSRTPRQVRAAYACELVNCIQTYMNATGVSLFFHELDPRYINCLATTGLCDSHGNEVPEHRIETCRYHISESGWTATCYRSGSHRVSTPDAASTHFWKFTECDPNNPSRLAGRMGSVICPILSIDDDDSKKALGVIRCSGLRNEFGTALGTVNSVGLQTLGLIAQQVGPYLHGLCSRIQREETISLLKHDLYSPLNLIWNTADRLETLSLKETSERAVKFSDLMNIKFSAELARTMLPQLSFDPGEVTQFIPERILLETNIISHIKHILNYFADIEKGMSIHYYGIRCIKPIYIDKLCIQRAVFNVVLNAIKYGEQGTQVKIKGIERTGVYVLMVENEGIGISADDAPYVFDLGFRSEVAKSLSQGNGHGLYVSKRFLQRHGGDVVLSTRSDPTTFELIFPKKLERDGWWFSEKQGPQ